MTRLFIKQGAGPARSGRAIPRPTVQGLRPSLPRRPGRRKPDRPGRAQIDVPVPAGRSIPCKVRPACYRTACAELTAAVTATAAANGKQQRPATAQDARTIRASWGYARSEKRTLGDHFPENAAFLRVQEVPLAAEHPAQGGQLPADVPVLPCLIVTGADGLPEGVAAVPILHSLMSCPRACTDILWNFLIFRIRMDDAADVQLTTALATGTN
jgi:hypothetical protein